jgi:hypothetical protein
VSPKQKFGADIIKMLDNLEESENDVFKGYGKNHNWKHKNYLWELPYAKALILHHNMDLNHRERNVAESIMSMCPNVTGFTKDNMNTRKYLAALCDRHSLEAKPSARGNLKRPKAPYYFKPTERKEVLRWLKTLKFPNHYVANIKWVVNVSTGKLNGLKSHEYHIFIERLMSVMFRGYFKPDLWKMFAELNYFYR